MANYKVKYPTGLITGKSDISLTLKHSGGIVSIPAFEILKEGSSEFFIFEGPEYNESELIVENNKPSKFVIPIRSNPNGISFNSKLQKINGDLSVHVTCSNKFYSVSSINVFVNGEKRNIFSKKNIFDCFISTVLNFSEELFGNVEIQYEYSFETDTGDNGIVLMNKEIIDLGNKNPFEEASYELNLNEKTLRLFWVSSVKSSYEIELISGNLKKNWKVNSSSFQLDNINNLIYKTGHDYNFVIKEKETGKIVSCIIANPHDSSINPHIFNVDYSGVLPPYREFGEGYIKWNNDISWEHSFEYKLECDILPHILEELYKPWEYFDSFMKNKPFTDFVKKYQTENVAVDVFNGYSQKVKNTYCNPKLNTGWINIGKENIVKIPLWFSHKEQTGFRFSVRVLDKWKNVISTQEGIEFKHVPDNPMQPSQTNPKIYRNQEICFGESGMINDFKKVSNPTPAELHKYYDYDKFKDRYTFEQLFDSSNVDGNGKSLFYYMNASVGPIISLKREDNWHKVGIQIIFEDGTKVFPEEDEFEKIYFRGEDYKDNLFQIDKKYFEKEGNYKVRIRTYNVADIESKVTEIEYSVYKEAPNKPEIEILQNDYYLEGEEIVINKNYFTISVINNAKSDKYNGWKYKEAHLYFKEQNSEYKQLPDYIAWTTADNSRLNITTNVLFADGTYDAKVVCFDYAGNATEATEIKGIKINKSITVNPGVFVVGKESSESFDWIMKLNSFTTGFFWKLYYSRFKNSEYKKVDEGFHPVFNKIDYIFNKNLISEDEINEGFYYLEVEEYNDIYPEGTGIKVKSNIVEAIYKSTISPKINFAENFDTAVINKNEINEWAFTSNIDNLEINFDHKLNHVGGINPVYIIELRSPLGRTYRVSKTVDIESGKIAVSKLQQLANILNPEEGVWEIRLIKVDEVGNSNENSGYFKSYFNYVLRLPEISSAFPSHPSGTKYFGLTNTELKYKVDTSGTYVDVINYQSHKEKFIIKEFRIKYIETPVGNEINSFVSVIDNDNNIKVGNNITSGNISSNSRDGHYLAEIKAIDMLGREGQPFYVDYQIDTSLDGTEIKFLNSQTSFQTKFTLTAQAIGDIQSVYYTFSEGKFNKDTWNRSHVSTSEIGKVVNFDLNFEDRGTYVMKYKLEEVSGNITEDRYHTIKVEKTESLYPVFDIGNKVFYDYKDSEFYITWNSSNPELRNFKSAIFKIKRNPISGETEYVSQFRPTLSGSFIEEDVHSDKVSWIPTGKEIRIPCSSNAFEKGYYSLQVKCEDSYGREYENSFRFQYNPEPMAVPNILLSSSVSISKNEINWEPISDAAYYEVSYDKETWIKTYECKFLVDFEKISENSLGQKCIYYRWVNSFGSKSEISSNIIEGNFEKLEAPIISVDKDITDNNSSISFKVHIPNPHKVCKLSYSFDRVNWKHKFNPEMDSVIQYDSLNVSDGLYTMYAYVSEDSDGSNSSPLSSASQRVYKDSVPNRPILHNIVYGDTYRDKVRLTLMNKTSDVIYKIYLNGRLVKEGTEVFTENLKVHNVKIDALVPGLNKVFHFYQIGSDNQNHVYDNSENFMFKTHGTEQQILNIGDGKLFAELDTSVVPPVLSIKSTPQLLKTEFIIYKEVGELKWNILNNGDKIDATKQYEFKIQQYSILK